MSEGDPSCQSLAENFGGETACGLVDVSSGTLLAAHASERLRSALDELAAVASRQLFRGESMGTLDRAMRSHLGAPAAEPNEEQEFYLSAGATAWFARSLRGRTFALLVVTDRTANLGLGWTLVRDAVPAFEAWLGSDSQRRTTEVRGDGVLR